MANTKREKLFAEFPPVPTEKWEEVIAVDLKGADYERKLVWRTPEGFNVRPYYRAENLEGLKFLASEPGEFPYVRGTRCDNVWRVHQSLTVKCPEAANAEALKLLDSGVDSLGFSLTKGLSAAEVETLLRDIHLPAVEVVFSGEGVADVVEPVLAKIEKECWLKTASVLFVLDPIINKLTLKGITEDQILFIQRRKLILTDNGSQCSGISYFCVAGKQLVCHILMIFSRIAFTDAVLHQS